MKVQFKDGVLTVKTGVTEEAVKAALGKRMVVENKNGDVVFVLSQTKDTKGQLVPFGITTNQVIDGELAFVEVVPQETKLEDIKAMYADALIAAAKYLPIITEDIQARSSALAAIFE